MKKSELKSIIRECLQEVELEEGVVQKVKNKYHKVNKERNLNPKTRSKRGVLTKIKRKLGDEYRALTTDALPGSSLQRRYDDTDD